MRTVTQETQVWGTSLYWRDCDPFVSVVGFNKEDIEIKARELAEDELKRVLDELPSGEENDLVLCGGQVFEYRVKDFILPSDHEHLRELAEDGITVV